MHPRLARWWVGALLVAWAPQALAANRFLKRAQNAYEQLEYDKVTPLLKKALAEPDTEPAEEVAIYSLLATMHVMYGRDAKAEEAFVEILERQPDFELPADSSPKLADAFAAAAKRHAERARDPTPEEPAAETQPGDTGGNGNEAGGNDNEAGGNGNEAGGNEAGGNGNEAGGSTGPPDPGRGDIMDPTRGRIAEPTPFYTTWWFWTVVGVVVAGAAGTTTYLLTQPRFPETAFGPYNL